MRVIASTGKEEVALVYILEFGDGKHLECVEAIQPPLPREDKWVLLVSTMFGCPVRCLMCDAGGGYKGVASKDEIMEQIEFLVHRRYPQASVPCRQFKIQFARMGEPALNLAVLDVLEELPRRLNAPGLMPSISTVAPSRGERFFERLLEIKRDMYPNGQFQFQFSIHTTDEALRDCIIPIKKWGFTEMAAYGERFYQPGDRKVTLNFALAKGYPVEVEKLRAYFSPEKFLIKITPLNPTYRAREHNLTSYVDPYESNEGDALFEALRKAGYEVIVSIGELEENLIGSNCGQYLRRHLSEQLSLEGGYTYQLQQI